MFPNTKPDPRVIFALVFMMSAYAVIIREDVIAVFALLVLTFLFAFLMDVGLGKLLSRLKRLLQIMLFVTVLRSFFTQTGIVIIGIGDFPLITTGGIAAGLLVAFRLIIFIVGASMFTVYPVRALIQAMVQLKLPYEIAYMVSIGVRFLPQLTEQFRDSLTALQLRGVVMEELKLQKRLSLYTYLLLPAIVSGMQQAKELSMSMEMRAFRAMSTRTSYFRLNLTVRDVFLLLGVLILAAAIGFVVFRFNFYHMIYYRGSV